MLSDLRRFWRLAAAERRLLLGALVLLSLIRAVLWLVSFPTLRGLLRRAGSALEWARALPRLSPERTAWAVSAASPYALGRQSCLTRALATQVLLAAQGESSRVCIGVSRDGEGGLEAHAWVESRGRVLIGQAEPGRFVALTALEAGSP